MENINLMLVTSEQKVMGRGLGSSLAFWLIGICLFFYKQTASMSPKLTWNSSCSTPPLNAGMAGAHHTVSGGKGVEQTGGDSNFHQGNLCL